MRTVLLILLLSTLGNADVVKLVKAGLSAETIEAKISTSQTSFDTSTDALVALAEAGVPDRVIRAMLSAKPPANAKPPVRKPAPANAGRRYDVTLHNDAGGKCEAELRLSKEGLSVSGCRDFRLQWSEITSICHKYGFRGTLLIETANGTRQLSTTTPAETKQIVAATRVSAPERLWPRPCSPD